MVHKCALETIPLCLLSVMPSNAKCFYLQVATALLEIDQALSEAVQALR